MCSEDDHYFRLLQQIKKYIILLFFVIQTKVVKFPFLIIFVLYKISGSKFIK